MKPYALMQSIGMSMSGPSNTQNAHRLSNTDRGILGLLREDSRMQVSEIAARLGVSRTTVRNRIDLLCERNVIKRFTIEIDGECVENTSSRSVFFILKLKQRTCKIIYENIKDWPEFIQAWSIAGQNDMLLQMHSTDNYGIEELRIRLGLDPEIQNLETIMVLSEWIKRTEQNGDRDGDPEIEIIR